MTGNIPEQELKDSCDVLNTILVGASAISDLTTQAAKALKTAAVENQLVAGWTGTEEQTLADEVFYRVRIAVSEIADGVATVDVTLALEAITNEVSLTVTKPINIEQSDTDITDALTIEEQVDVAVLDVISCKGVDEDDIEEKISYLENLETLLDVLI